MTTRSRKLDLIAEARQHVAASVVPAAALVIHRLKQTPNATDATVWHATADVLEREGHPVAAAELRGATAYLDPPGAPSVASLLRESDYYGPLPEVTI